MDDSRVELARAEYAAVCIICRARSEIAARIFARLEEPERVGILARVRRALRIRRR